MVFSVKTGRVKKHEKNFSTEKKTQSKKTWLFVT